MPSEHSRILEPSSLSQMKDVIFKGEKIFSPTSLSTEINTCRSHGHRKVQAESP